MSRKLAIGLGIGAVVLGGIGIGGYMVMKIGMEEQARQAVEAFGATSGASASYSGIDADPLALSVTITDFEAVLPTLITVRAGRLTASDFKLDGDHPTHLDLTFESLFIDGESQAKAAGLAPPLPFRTGTADRLAFDDLDLTRPMDLPAGRLSGKAVIMDAMTYTYVLPGDSEVAEATYGHAETGEIIDGVMERLEITDFRQAQGAGSMTTRRVVTGPMDISAYSRMMTAGGEDQNRLMALLASLPVSMSFEDAVITNPKFPEPVRITRMAYDDLVADQGVIMRASVTVDGYQLTPEGMPDGAVRRSLEDLMAQSGQPFVSLALGWRHSLEPETGEAAVGPLHIGLGDVGSVTVSTSLTGLTAEALNHALRGQNAAAEVGQSLLVRDLSLRVDRSIASQTLLEDGMAEDGVTPDEVAMEVESQVRGLLTQAAGADVADAAGTAIGNWLRAPGTVSLSLSATDEPMQIGMVPLAFAIAPKRLFEAYALTARFDPK